MIIITIVILVLEDPMSLQLSFDYHLPFTDTSACAPANPAGQGAT